MKVWLWVKAWNAVREKKKKPTKKTFCLVSHFPMLLFGDSVDVTKYNYVCDFKGDSAHVRAQACTECLLIPQCSGGCMNCDNSDNFSVLPKKTCLLSEIKKFWLFGTALDFPSIIPQHKVFIWKTYWHSSAKAIVPDSNVNSMPLALCLMPKVQRDFPHYTASFDLS